MYRIDFSLICSDIDLLIQNGPEQNKSTFLIPPGRNDEQTNIEKRDVILQSGITPYSAWWPYSSFYPYYSQVGIVKRDTTAAESTEGEKNIEKRDVIVGSPFAYPYSSWFRYINTAPVASVPYYPYGLVKRQSEEATQSEHIVEKRDVSQDEETKTEEKRDLVLGYGYPYYSNYEGYPYYRSFYRSLYYPYY
ncbi:hypothetical protein HHI36_008313 [Cryptolaemus montrouzieri]|uniref:Uncharacterized protein n=1 Tax=Cryptolaemus montrouzieri TaxID=559131 RepID=A0ABD2MSM8_9CUCU